MRITLNANVIPVTQVERKRCYNIEISFDDELLTEVADMYTLLRKKNEVIDMSATIEE